jgi:triphosphoribosyl-dephospho-CoA synthase
MRDVPAGLCAHLACLWEATARKPGNVHRFIDFDDVGYLDFVLSAAAIAPVFDRAYERLVGQTVLEAIQATRRVVATNTNLGMVLLLAPLAAVPASQTLRDGVADVLRSLTVADARAAYEAIRLAQPGGLGTAPEQDVRNEPTRSLWEVMALAAERDLIARQYANGFRAVWDIGLPGLQQGLQQAVSLEEAIITCHLHLLRELPDSLIARKRGLAAADQASRRASQVLALGWPRSDTGLQAIAEFDAWLRADGHARNPGTTADLVAACLFAALRENLLTVPPALPWSAPPPPHKIAAL